MTLASARSIHLAVIAAWLMANALGCASRLNSDRAPTPAPAEVTMASMVQTTGEPVCLIYRTCSDRITSSAGHLPPCCIMELRVVYPHAAGTTGMCQAQVTATPCTQEATPFPERGWSASLASFRGSDSAASVPPAQAWAGDVPLWQIQAVVKAMEKANFFDKRRTVLGPEVFLSIETKEHAVGKRYRPVPELDAMLVRVVRGTSHAFAGPTAAAGPSPHGQPLTSQEAAMLARLPSIDR